MVLLWHLPSAYRAPWQGQTPTPQRGKFKDATAAHCLVTGSYLSVQSKIIESFSPGETQILSYRLKTVEVISFLGLKHDSSLTSHHVNHALQHGHPQPAAGLVQGRHGGPVLVEGVEALHTTQRAAVTPAAALQPSVAPWEEI